MKINSPLDIFRLKETIRAKQDGQGGAGQQQYDAMFQDGHGSNKDQSKQGASPDPDQAAPKDVDPAIIDLALSIFEADAKTKQSGLVAEKEGTGPGLKVILRDASGRIIRSLSGQDFLKLREGSAQDSKSRGKLLDQKF